MSASLLWQTQPVGWKKGKSELKRPHPRIPCKYPVRHFSQRRNIHLEMASEKYLSPLGLAHVQWGTAVFDGQDTLSQCSPKSPSPHFLLLKPQHHFVIKPLSCQLADVSYGLTADEQYKKRWLCLFIQPYLFGTINRVVKSPAYFFQSLSQNLCSVLNIRRKKKSILNTGMINIYLSNQTSIKQFECTVLQQLWSVQRWSRFLPCKRLSFNNEYKWHGVLSTRITLPSS